MTVFPRVTHNSVADIWNSLRKITVCNSYTQSYGVSHLGFCYLFVNLYSGWTQDLRKH
jgi:hypothetical protein